MFRGAPDGCSRAFRNEKPKRPSKRRHLPSLVTKTSKVNTQQVLVNCRVGDQTADSRPASRSCKTTHYRGGKGEETPKVQSMAGLKRSKTL